ncbi:hypothetical protein ABPG72_019920 [Tetrahymena utriculariae]
MKTLLKRAIKIQNQISNNSFDRLYLQNGSCFQTCLAGYYGNNETSLCSQCHPYCSSFFGKEVYECLGCNNGYSLSGTTCGSKCPDGQYQDKNINTCQNCHFECFTCGGPEKKDCIGCKGERYLDQQLYFCDSSCPEKTYKGENNICQPCYATFANCQGPNYQNDCIKCNQGSYLYDNQCLLTCPDGHFQTERSFLCNKCHESCAQCQFGAQSRDCTQCAGKYYFEGSKCAKFTACQDKSYLFQNQCQTDCPKGYQPSLIKKECIRCEEGCNTCPVIDPAICLSCQNGAFLHQSKCLSQCPDGTYLGISAITNPNRLLNQALIEENETKSQEICLNCADDCRKCSGSLKQECTQWFEEREVNYTEYRIFWIFFGKTIFCFMSLIAGFYLDYKEELVQEEKMNIPKISNQEDERVIQQNNKETIPLNTQKHQPVNGLLDALSNPQDKNININEAETVKSYDENIVLLFMKGIQQARKESCLNSKSKLFFLTDRFHIYKIDYKNVNTFCVLMNGQQFSSKKWFQKGNTTIELGDTDGWSLTSSNAYYKTCTGTLTELLNRDLFTLKSQSSISRIYRNLPPHWSVGVRFDLVIQQYEQTCLSIDNVQADCYSDSGYTFTYAVCTSKNDKFLRVYTNKTHTQSSLKLNLDSKNNYVILSLVEIYLDRCHSSCLTCNGPTDSNCQTCHSTCISTTTNSGKCQCAAGKYMKDGICNSTCPSGFVINPDTTKQTCIFDYCSTAPENIYCLTCQSSTFYTQCKLPYIFYKGQCVDQCPPEAPKTSDGICKDPTAGKWNAKFLVYKLFSSTFSESEIIGAKFNIQANLYYGKPPWTKFSDFSTPDTYKLIITNTLGQIENESFGLREFIVMVDYVLVCNPSFPPCFRCTGGNYNQCQACISGYFLDSDKSECVFVCQDRFYPNSSTNTCDSCDLECFNCNGPNNNQCNQCELPRFLQGTQCKLNCPPGYFGNKKTCKCEPCTSPCAECVDLPTKCTKCDKPTLYLDDFSCVLNCQNKKYKDDATMRCEKCNIQCGNCNGPFSNQCITCDLEDGFLLATTCVQDCGDGYFPVSDPAYICQKCHKSCKTCKNPGLNTSCTSCNNQYLTPQGQCMDNCPIGYYQDPSIYLCKQCHETCLTCSDQYSISCLTCCQGRYFLNGLCVTICPSNTFPLDLKGCQPCHPSCATCYGYFPQNCLSCRLGNYLENGFCVLTCKTGYYGNNETGTCSQCHPYCASCFGKEVYERMSCNSSYSLSGMTFGSDCRIGQYKDTNLNTCSNCHFECYTCKGKDKNDCTGCKGERYLDQQLHFCDSSCPEKTYKGDNNMCQPCHQTCAGCIEKTDKNCIKCNQGSYLYNNQCILACPDGYFSSEQPFLCNKCHYSCAQCQFGAQNSDCTSCAGNYYLDGANCVQACPKGSFGSITPNQCLPCHSSCAECSGPNYNQCITCQDTTYKFENICQTDCPKGYQPSKIKKECIKCEEGCNSCSVQDPNICLSCQKGAYLHQNRCISLCPDGTYLGSAVATNPNRALAENLIIEDNPNISTEICLNCADDCRKCTGSLKQDCTQQFDERKVKYAEYRIFWIFFGKSVFCIVSLLAGFYLDYRDEVRQEEKLNSPMKNNQEDERQRMIQQNNAKIFPINEPQSQQVSGLLPISPQVYDIHSNINEIETVKSYQKHDEKDSPQVNEKDLMNNNGIKKRQRLDLNQLQNNSLKFNNFNKNTQANLENDQKKGLDIDLLFYPNILNTQNINLKQSNNRLSINGQENKDEVNANTQVQLANNYQIQNDNDMMINKQKSPILAFFTFFEVTQLFLYKNINFMRPVRILVYYSKLLFIFFITSFFSNIDYYLIGVCMLGLLLTVKLLHSGIIYLGIKFQSLIMLCFAIFIVLIFLHVKMFMFPEIDRISFPQDISWSNLYMYTFLADLGFLSLQHMTSLLSILSSMTYSIEF